MSSLETPVAPQSAQPSISFSPRARCRHVSRTGRACRYRAVSASQPFCKHHLPPGSPEHLSEQMFRVCHNFMTPDHVTNVLHSIFFALADGEISERRAGMLTYILQTILNSQRANLQLQKLVATSERQGLDVDNPFDCNAETASAAAPATGSDKLTSNLPPASPVSPCSGQSSDWPAQSAAPLSSSNSSGAPDSSSEPASALSPGTPISQSPADDTSSDAAPAPCSGRSSDASERPLQPPRTTPEKSAPPLELNHFFPRDPSLPRHIQNPDCFCSPPPLNRPKFLRVARPRPGDSDWKVINGR